MRWNDIRVREKFLLSLSPLIIVLALQSGLSVLTIRGLGWNISNVGEGWEHRTQVTEVEKAITGAQAAVRIFLLSNRAEDWTRVEDAIAAVSARIDEARPRLEQAEGMTSQLSAVVRAVDKYRGAVYRIRDLSKARDETYQTAVRDTIRAEEQTLSEIMRAAYHEGDAVSSFYAGSGLAELTEISGAVSLCMAGDVEEAKAVMAAHYDELSDNLKLLAGNATTRFGRKQVGVLQEETEGLKRGFEVLLETTVQRERAMGAEVTPAAQTLGEALRRISQLALEGTREISRAAGEDASHAALTSGGFAAGGIAIAILVALWAGRSLAGPLVGMTWIMTALAEGDTTIAVPDAHRGDEIGQMAKSLEVFKENARRAARLAAEREAAHRQLEKTQQHLIQAEKMAALGQMVAGIAHEVNTPVGATLAVASTLEEKAEVFAATAKRGELRRSMLDTFLGDLTEATGIIQRNLRRASTLIANFKQVAVDQASERRRSFDCQTLTSEVISTLRPTVKHHDIGIIIEIASGIVMDSYPGAFGQVITNLVTNAFAHAFEGRSHGTLRLSAAVADDCLTLTVADDGAGIPQDVLPRIFDPFYTTKLGHGGSGLGLYLAYGIVTRILGGRVSVASRVDEGTTFTLVLPLVAPKSDPE